MSFGRNVPTPTTYTRLLGGKNTLAPFIKMVGNQQVLSGEGGAISVENYHTKIYSKGVPINLTLGSGEQEGQIKRITFVHKGHASATITVQAPSLQGIQSSIIFSKVGDQIDLLWSKGEWYPIYSLNLHDLVSNTPELI